MAEVKTNSETQKSSHELPRNDIYRMYMNEIGRVALLDRDEEFSLGAKAQDGDVEAANALVKANLRLVASIARRLHDPNSSGSLELLDFIQEGNIALISAVEEFDVGRGSRFSTYATWLIRGAIFGAFSNQSRTIRIPRKMLQGIKEMETTQGNLEDELDRPPTVDELASSLGKSPESVALMQKAQSSMNIMRLDMPVGDGEYTETLGDLIADDQNKGPDELAEDASLKSELQLRLDRLTPFERKLVSAKFGLDGGSEKTNQEIGVLYGYSRERIRQIITGAIEKIRGQEDVDDLRVYLD